MGLIYGTETDDVLSGTSEADEVLGLGGDDIINGLDGADELQGGSGDDVLNGGSGDDELLGGEGFDELRGGGGDDLMVWSAGNDMFIGGSGIDTLSFAHASTGVTVNLAVSSNQTTATQSNFILDVESIIGSAYNDVLTAAGGGGRLYGGAGNDKLTGAANDVLEGGSGADVITGGIASFENAFSAVQVNLITLSHTGEAYGDTYANISSWRMSGHSDVFTGAGAADIVDGGAGADQLNGGAGNDWLTGALGDDILSGQANDDHLNGGEGSDTLHGGDGVDRLSETSATGSDVLNGDAGDDTIVLQRAYGGSASSVTLNGGAGADLISILDHSANDIVSVDGGDGDDTLVLRSAAGELLITLGAGADEIDWTGFVVDSTSHIVFSDFDPQGQGDLFVGFVEFLNANLTNWDGTTNPFGSGHLRLVQVGQDTILETDFDGGGDNYSEFIRFSDTDAAELEDVFGFATDGSETNVIQGTPDDDVLTGTPENDFISGFEGNDTLSGEGGDDTLDGGAGDDDLSGGQGDDDLTGGDGNDYLRGDAGADSLTGGAGFDTAGYESAAGGVTVELGLVTAQDTGGGGVDQLSSIERIVGSAFADVLSAGTAVDVTLEGRSGEDQLAGGTGDDVLRGGADADVLTGDSGNDRLEGGAGADQMAGGLGDDWYYVDDAGDAVTETAGEGATDRIFAGVSYTLSAGSAVEVLSTTLQSGTAAIDLTGNELDNSIAGNDGANVLTGLDGNDRLFGNGGDDVLHGGLGQNYLNGGNGIDSVDYSWGSAGLSIHLGAGIASLGTDASDTLKDIENATGTAFADYMAGSEADNILIGGSGNDTLNGLAGADVLIGGAGDDHYWVDHSGDEVREFASEGMDTVSTSVSFSAAGTDIERLLTIDIYGTSAIDLTGNALNNLIRGNAGANILIGGQGNDELDGLGGVDHLDGGEGDDTFWVNAGDTVADSGGYDTVIARSSYTLNAGVAIEVLKADGYSGYTLVGNEFGQTMTHGSVMYGGGGNDVLMTRSGVLHGEDGDDVMVAWDTMFSVDMFGGSGNDWYYVNLTADVFDSGGNADRVLTYWSWTLDDGDGIEILTTNNVASTSAFNLTGNSLDNTVAGNNGANVLRGLVGADTLHGHGGADTLVGGAGNDTLWGGSGADGFLYDAAAFGADLVRDFENGTDAIRVQGIAGVDDFSDLSVSNNAQGWAVITFPDGSTISLFGVDAGLVDASDFVFGP